MGVDLSRLCSCIDLGLAHEREWLAGCCALRLPVCPRFPAQPACHFASWSPAPRPCSRTILERYGRGPREREGRRGAACRRAGRADAEGVALTGLRLRGADVGKCPSQHPNHRACKGRRHSPLQIAHHLTGSRLAPWWRWTAEVQIHRIIDLNLHQRIPRLAR